MDIKLQTSQKQILTHQMVQTSEILQMNNIELEMYIQNLALENPLLDFEMSPPENSRKKEWLNNLDDQNRVYKNQEEQDTSDFWDLNTAMTETLEETLVFQVRSLKLPPAKETILIYLIQNLDSNGYLNIPLEELSLNCHTPISQLEEALSILQTLEPDGVGARSLGECLTIQLNKKAPKEKLAFLIIHKYLDLLGKNQIPAIAHALHESQKEVLKACNLIRSLTPKPGSPFGDRQFMSYIHPELIIIRFDNYFDIFLDDSSIPVLHINSYYLELLKKDQSPETTHYLKRKKEELDQFQSCIQYRSSTLISLGKLIVTHQQDFFLHGPGHLHTFLQSTAASMLGIHESVISRAVNSKYLQCQYGIFPLAYFFVQGRDDKDLIKIKIRNFIQQENKFHPYSDQKLSDLLAEQGLTVSKRLVTKYRTALNIPPASSRRTYKK